MNGARGEGDREGDGERDAARDAELDERAQRWAAAELARRALIDVATELRHVGVKLLAFKGIHVAYDVAPHPSARPLGDADALVIEGSFARAIDALRASDLWALREDDWSAVMAQAHRGGAAVDLHRSAYPAFFPALNSIALAEAATSPSSNLGPGVVVPSVVDAAAIALANYVKDRAGTFGLGGVAHDLAWLADRRGVTASDLAARAPALGVRRVCLVGLTAIARDDDRWSRWADALAEGSRERRWAEGAVDALRWSTSRSDAAGFVVFRTLADRVRDVPASLVFGAATRIPWRLARAIGELRKASSQRKGG